jgi:hypothetical protein
MALAPMSPTTYAWGALAYNFTSGLCYGTYTALVLEVVGPDEAGASTRYTLFTAAANLAIAYVTALDGVGATWWAHHRGAAAGPRGLLWTDALLNLFGVMLLATLLTRLRPRRRPN